MRVWRHLVHTGLCYQQIRYIFSKTGQWKKKITKKVLAEVEAHWKEKVLSPVTSTPTRNQKDKVVDRKYILSMFPYPSGDLHMGHMRVYTISDVLARYHRLNGSEVLHPIGWDAFGLPAENAAIEHEVSPKQWTESNICRMKDQLKDLRISFDWDRELRTCDPEYYKWTQWIFLLMYERGLAYRRKAMVSWDPVDNTVLADEQIDSQGHSWRSGAKVEKKLLTQWYLRTTNYSQSLLDGLDTLHPESCKGFANAQKNWLGKPTGVRVIAAIEIKGRMSSEDVISVFTECSEFIGAVDFLQISSSHPLVCQTTDGTKTVEGRLLSDVKMRHPLTDERLPVIVLDDDRLAGRIDCRFGISSLYHEDKKLCSRFNIPCNESSGTVKLNREEARKHKNKLLRELRVGGWPSNPELHDWCISRQRCWGTPIPIIHCTFCGTLPVPERNLPVKLPDIDKITREGGNPLLSNEEWINTICPRCRKPAKRETDTMDTFVDSSWYYLRYTDPHNTQRPFSKEKANVHMPVNVYVGGAEHAILHMYFARFFNHFLFDEDMTSQREPFTLQLALGTVHSNCYKVEETGKYLHESKVRVKGAKVTEKSTGLPVIHTVEKMSKSKYNGVNPNDILAKHGVDQTRLYMLANEGPRSTKNWNQELADKLMFAHGKQISIPRWFHTLWHTVGLIKSRRELLSPDQLKHEDPNEETKKSLYRVRNSSIRSASHHLGFTFNLHEVVHMLYDNLYVIDTTPLDSKIQSADFEECFADLLILLHPLAPHITGELWEGLRSSRRLSGGSSQHNWNENIFGQKWPTVHDDFNLTLLIRSFNGDTTDSEEDSQSEEQQQTDSDQSELLGEEEKCGRRPSLQKKIHLPASKFQTLTVAEAVKLALESDKITLKVCDSFRLDDDCIMAAPCTPMLANGDVNLSGFEAYADNMVASGINSLFVNGTLGEGMSMTREERKAALEQWMKVKEGRFKTVIAHVSAGSIRDTVDLAKHADSVGVDAIAVMCPTFFKPSSISNLVHYLKAVADHAPNRPFLYYDINVLTGVVFDTGEVMRQCKAQIPSFSGIKYSCRELGNYEAAVIESENGRYKLAVGAVDEEFLPWLPLGAQVPICHSLMGNIHKATKAAYLAGDTKAAAKSQQSAQKVGIIKRKYGPDIPVSKAILRMMGVDMGPVRLPLEDLTHEAYAQLQKELKGIKFLA